MHRAVTPGPGGGTGMSEDVLPRGSGLARHHHRAGVQQNTWSGYPGGKKGALAPVWFFFFFFTFKVSAAMQMEEFANPRPQEELIAPAVRPVPMQCLHIGEPYK